MDEIKHVVCFPTICLRQVMGYVKDKTAIVELEAYRSYRKDSKRGLELPFFWERFISKRSFYLNFRGYRKDSQKKGHYGAFPTRKILQLLETRGIEDMVIQKLSIFNENPKAYKLFEVFDVGNLERERGLILTFENVPHKNKKISEFLRKQILGEHGETEMAHNIKRLKFKIATLDLIRLQTVNQWRKNIISNLLPESNMKTLQLLVNPLFEPETRIIRTYHQRANLEWVLVGTRRF